jgi:hypothetical protein
MENVRNRYEVMIGEMGFLNEMKAFLDLEPANRENLWFAFG